MPSASHASPAVDSHEEIRHSPRALRMGFVLHLSARPVFMRTLASTWKRGSHMIMIMTVD